jgi:hypothetical protein
MCAYINVCVFNAHAEKQYENIFEIIDCNGGTNIATRG